MPAYRLLTDFDAHGQTLTPGTLLFPWQLGAYGTLPPGTLRLSRAVNGQGFQLHVPRELVEPITQPKAGEFEQLTRFYLTGHEVPPHLQRDTDTEADLNWLAHCYAGTPFQGSIRLPSDDRRGEMALAIMGRTQGGELTGSAVALRYLPSWGNQDKGPRTVRFALCSHDKQVGAGANPQRGWHPGRCAKCGLDMTVDSGD